MAQKKLKAKALPRNDAKKKKTIKGPSATKRANRPVKPKKALEEGKKLKQMISKTVNKAVEDEIRLRAANEDITLSKAQESVAKYNHRK